MTTQPGSVLVPYRGERGYVHGTTMFERLRGPISGRALANLDFRFNRRLDSTRVRLVQQVPRTELPSYHCSFECLADGVPWTCAAQEVPGPDPAFRDAYDEAALVARAKFTADGVHLVAPMHPVIDAVVALNKQLLIRMYPLPASTQYVFARLEATGWPTASTVDLKFIRRLGTSNFISRLDIDGRHAGLIHFAWSSM